MMTDTKMRDIYCDYHATTPCDPTVIAAMQPFWAEEFGNPHALYYPQSLTANDAVMNAKADIARCLGAKRKNIIITAGATEANNLAIIGGISALIRQSSSHGKSPHGKSPHIMISPLEHKAALEPAYIMAKQHNLVLSLIKHHDNSLCDLEHLENMLANAQRANQIPFVIIMLAHNEIGTIQPIKDIAKRVKKHGGYIMCDAAQAVGKIPVNVTDLQVDYLSLSGHKFYGPKGVGALYYHKHAPIEPIIHGGGQENGLRSGTLPVPLIVGLSHAMVLAEHRRQDDHHNIMELRDSLWQVLSAQIPDIRINGVWENNTARHCIAEYRLAGNLHCTIPKIDADHFRQHLNHVAVSYGSACQAGQHKANHVLQALGFDQTEHAVHMRIGLGRYNHADDIPVIVQRIAQAVALSH